MFKIILIVGIWLLNLTVSADINYYIKHNSNKIHVLADFGNYKKNSKINLFIPTNIWGINYSEQIKNIKVKNGSYNPNKHTVSLKKEGNLIVEYDIINIPKERFAIEFGDKYYHYFDEKKFFILGLGFFIYPNHLEQAVIDEKVLIRIDSPSKIIASTISPYFYTEIIKTDFTKLSSLMILGNDDFYYVTNPALNNKILIWSADKILGERISTIVNKVLTQHKLFWEDKNFDQLAVIIPNPYNIKRNKWGGTVINQNLFGFINPNTNQDSDLYNLFNHEALHFWFGYNLIHGPQWFREGFVDYYMDKINYHYNGDKKLFIENYNTKLLSYFSFPFTDLNDSFIKEQFFKIRAIQKLPYIKGYLIAGQIDSIIDLDVIFKSIITDCRTTKITCKFSEDLLFQYANNINEQQKIEIRNIINNFNYDNLNNRLLNMASLNLKKIEAPHYNIDLEKIVKLGYVSGGFLKTINNKYNKKKNYNLLDIHRDEKNNMHFFIKVDDKQEEFFPLFDLKLINIPYYN